METKTKTKSKVTNYFKVYAVDGRYADVHELYTFDDADPAALRSAYDQAHTRAVAINRIGRLDARLACISVYNKPAADGPWQDVAVIHGESVRNSFRLVAA